MRMFSVPAAQLIRNVPSAKGKLVFTHFERFHKQRSTQLRGTLWGKRLINSFFLKDTEFPLVATSKIKGTALCLLRVLPPPSP